MINGLKEVMSRYSIIHKDGSETHYVWCDKTKQMVVKPMNETAVIYSNGSQECERITSLLRSLGGEFLEYKLNHHFSQKGFEAEFGPDAEYPQINIGYKHIGGLKDTLHYFQNNKVI